MDGIKPTILACIVLFLLANNASGVVLKKSNPEILSKANRITIPFVENKGQLKDPNILFYSNTFAGRVSVSRDGSIGYGLMGNKAGKEKQINEIREKLRGASITFPTGGQKAIAGINHFQGNDPQKWVTDIPTFNSINIGEIYPGVSLRLQARANNVEKIFSVSPGADPKKIQLTIDGAMAVGLTSKGELEVNTRVGAMRFTKPVAYQWIDGRKTPVDASYTVQGTSYGFKLDAYDKTRELIIDPLITGIIQGTADTKSRPTCLAADSKGNIYVAGISANQFAVFKFDSELKNLLNSAYFGSVSSWTYVGSPAVYDIAVDKQDVVYLVGCTQDKDFPVTPGAFDTSFGGGEFSWLRSDGFVIKANADLSTILSSTFIGEDGFDAAYGIAIARDDSVYIVGETKGHGPNTTPFPTTPDAYDTTSARYQKSKAFVMRLNSDLQTLLASTQLGYNGENENDTVLRDEAYDIAIDAEGAVFVTGRTESEHFPVTGNCVDSSFDGKAEVFIAKFDADLQNLLASTFLGGADQEKANVLAIAANNEIVVAGWTMSPDFPIIQGNYDTRYSGAHEDGFVTRLSNDLTAIRASTFLGGNGHEQVSDMVIGEDGKVYICGGTGSSDFPVTENFHDDSFNGGMPNNFYEGDGFIAIFDRALTTLNASTYLGGRWKDHITAILVKNDDIFVAGETYSWDFPYVTERTGDSDAFICRFNPNEEPWDRPFRGRSGHWESKDFGGADQIYLDVNICDNGSFSGLLKVYVCGIPGWACGLPDDAPSSSVSGTIDFQKWGGAITIGDACKDVPFRISKQIANEFLIYIDPDASADNCFRGARSFLYFKGENEANTCQLGPDGGGGSGSDSGGGGCLINVLMDGYSSN